MSFAGAGIIGLPIVGAGLLGAVGASMTITYVGGKVAAKIANPLYDKLSVKMKKDLVDQLGKNDIPQLDVDPVAEIFKKHVKKHGKISEKELNADVEKIIETIIPKALLDDKKKDLKSLITGEIKDISVKFDDSTKKVKMTMTDANGFTKTKVLPEGLDVDDVKASLKVIKEAKQNVKEGLKVANKNPYKFLSVMATVGKCLATVGMAFGICAMMVGAVPLGAAVFAGGLVLLGASCAATVAHSERYCNGITDEQVKALNGTIAQTAKALEIAGRSQSDSKAMDDAFRDRNAVNNLVAQKELSQSQEQTLSK